MLHFRDSNFVPDYEPKTKRFKTEEVSIVEQVKLLSQTILSEEQIAEKLTLIAGKVFSWEAKESGKGLHLATILEETFQKQRLSQNDPSIRKQIKSTQQACAFLKDFLEVKQDQKQPESLPKEWTAKLQKEAEAQTSRVTEAASASLGELHDLQDFLSDLILPKDALQKLEELNAELVELNDESMQEQGLLDALHQLKRVHACRYKLKEITASIHKNLLAWEEARSSSYHIDIDLETELHREYGDKHARLIEQAEFLKQAQLPGVEVPVPQGLSNSALQKFLAMYVPELEGQWKALNEGFKVFQNTRIDGQPDSAYLQQAEVKTVLEQIKNEITVAFVKVASDPAVHADLQEWLQKQKGYLMVRSSGAEDSRVASNAGGNLSMPYVAPNVKSLCLATGQVVASYFGEASLQNRLNNGQNPFAEPQRVAVSIQELIGESIIDRSGHRESDARHIPVSLVLFSNEPTFVGKEPFRIMRISATYGHGEGVVGATGVRSDTYTLLRSLKHPKKIYVLEDIAAKPTRLAPVKDDETGEITLQKVDNPLEMAHKASLDPRLLTQLYYLGVSVEKVYGHPMDMEMVIKDGKIYPVQARPVNRPDANPTYLDLNRVAAAEREGGQSERFRAEPFLPGLAQAQVLRDAREILICDTLENAEKQFKKGQHRLIFIKQEEPANSHPVVNFSGLGIPVMYSQEQEQLLELTKRASGNTPLIACVQTGHMILCPHGDAESLISNGYTVHPARVALSVDRQQLPVVTQTTELPQEIKALLMQVTALESQQVTLRAIRELKQQLNVALETGRQLLAERLERDPNLPRGQTLQQGMEAWERVTNEALSALKRSVKAGTGKRLEPLFYAKVVENLATQKGAPQALGRLSLLNIDDQLQAVSKIADYRAKFADPSQTQFSERILDASALFTKEQGKQWEQFLMALEDAYQENRISPAETEAFQHMLQQLEELQLLPIWMARFFLPTIAAEQHEQPALHSADAAAIMRSLIAEFPKNPAFLNDLRKHSEDIVELRNNLGQFATAKQFTSAWEQLQTLCQSFMGEGAMSWGSQLQSGGTLERIAAIQVMGQLIDLYDSSIKSMKASHSYSNQEKVGLFRTMLEGYSALQKDWAIHLSKDLIKYHKDWPLDNYLKKMDDLLKGFSDSSDMLDKSTGFSVSAAILGNQTAFERSSPGTMEDFFTLTHQNLLVGLEALLVREMKDKIALPDSISTAMATVTKQLGDKAQLTGYSFGDNQIKISYNYPLRNHSATFCLLYDKKGNISLQVSFLGQARQRWDKIAKFMRLFDAARCIELKSPPKVESMALTYSLNLTEPDSLEPWSLFKLAADFSMDDRVEGFKSKITNLQSPLLKMILPRQLEEAVLYSQLCPLKFPDAPQRFQRNEQVVLAVVKQYGNMLQYASEELRNNKEVVLAAVTQNGMALQYASEELRNNKEVVLAAVTQNGNALQYASEEMRNNKEVVLAAVTQNGMALQYASEEMRNNKEIVLAAVKQNITVLQYASEEMRNNKEIVLAAVKQNGMALQYASEEMRNNKEIVLAAVKQNITVLQYASEELRNNPEIVQAAMKKRLVALQYAGEKIRNDKEFNLAAVKENAWALEYASEEMRNTKEIVLAAVIKNGWTLKYASEDMRNDEEIVFAAIKQHPRALEHASEATILAAISQDAALYPQIDPKLKEKREFILKMVSVNPKVRSYLSFTMKKTLEQAGL